MAGRGESILWLGQLHQVGSNEINLAQRQLSDAAAAGLPVLPGFVISSAAYRQFLQDTHLASFIAEQFRTIDWQRPRNVAWVSRQIQKKIEATVLPPRLVADLERAYQQLTAERGQKVEVVLAPSVLGFEQFDLTLPKRLPVLNSQALLKAFVHLSAQLFDVHHLLPTTLESLINQKAALTILVQLATPVTHSGFAETGPIVKIEAIYGRPEPLEQRLLSPDVYQVDPESLTVVSRDINKQPWQVAQLSLKLKHQKVASLDQSLPKLEEVDVLEVAKLALVVDEAADYGLRIGWVIDLLGKLWLTSIERQDTTVPYRLPNQYAISAQLIVQGKMGAAGQATGPARIIAHRRDLKEIQAGDIAVVESPDVLQLEMVPQLAGLITETGQRQHPVLMAMTEYGLPAVLGVVGAQQKITNGQLVTVDGRTGAVYSGRVTPGGEHQAQSATALITGTKIYTRPASLEQLTDHSVALSDGVGYLSSTLIWQTLGHPKALLKSKSPKEVTALLVDQLKTAATALDGKPVLYVTHDGYGGDYAKMAGGEAHEFTEGNPLLGYRGAHRALAELDVLKVELEAIRQVRQEHGLHNLHLMLPFVRTIDQLVAFKQHVQAAGLSVKEGFRLWLLCQVPASVIHLYQICRDEMVEGVCIDLDHLSQLLLGIDHEHPELRHEYQLTDGAVMATVAQAVQTARTAGLPALAVSTELAHNPTLIEGLVGCGITGLITESAHAKPLRKLVASAEQRILLDHAVAQVHSST